MTRYQVFYAVLHLLSLLCWSKRTLGTGDVEVKKVAAYTYALGQDLKIRVLKHKLEFYPYLLQIGFISKIQHMVKGPLSFLNFCCQNF